MTVFLFLMEGSAFFLFLLADALFFAALGGFNLDVCSHAAGAKTPFSVGEREGRAQLGALTALNAVTAAALFDNRPTLGLSVDGGAVHIIYLSWRTRKGVLKIPVPSRGQTILIMLFIKKIMSSHFITNGN